MEAEFEILASKVLAGEATAEERVRLDEMLADNAGLREDFAGLETAWSALREAGSVAHALDSPPARIPDPRLRELQGAVRTMFAASSGPTASPVAPPAVEKTAVGTDPICQFWPFGRFWQWLVHPAGAWRLAALLVLTLISVSALLYVNRPSGSVAISDPLPVAYCVVGEGSPEVRRGGKPLTMGLTAIRIEDQLHLPAGAQVTLITSNGVGILRGPRRFSGNDLAVQAGTPLATNATGLALRTVLFTRAGGLPAAGLLVAMRDGKAIPLYSPNGATTDLTPLMLWKAESGKRYDLLITDEFDAKTTPWRVTDVRSPLDFSQVESWNGRALAENGLYRLRVGETGKPLTACEYTFRTLSGAEAPAGQTPDGKLLKAFTILNSTPSRLGDALTELLTLPPDLANSELALRLKLLAYGRLGYVEDFEAAAAQLLRSEPPSR